MVLVRELMKRDVTTIGMDASLALAARIMRDQDVGCLPVLEGEPLVGMITERDTIVRGVAAGLDPYRVAVREAMSTKAISCSVEHTVDKEITGRVVPEQDALLPVQHERRGRHIRHWPYRRPDRACSGCQKISSNFSQTRVDSKPYGSSLD
jgi:predicted transcriptional regulator